MIDVAQAIDEEAVPVTIISRGPATYDRRGNAILGPQSVTNALAALQPVSGRTLQDLPEGLRNDAALVGWSRSTVAVDNEIVYGGSTYRVTQVWPRPADGFCKFVLKGVTD